MKPLTRILHVEDDRDILDLAGICLGDIGGFQLAQFSDGKRAVKNAPDFTPDLFLLDMMMPEMDGIETLHQLHQCTGLSDVPAIFVTAKNVDGSKPPEELGSNVIGVIEKPFEAVHLAAIVSRMWLDFQNQSKFA